MRNIINKILFTAGLVLLFASCEKISTSGVSKVTRYIDFELEGGAIQTVQVGDISFVVPGYKAFDSGVNVTGDPQYVTVEGVDDADVSAPGYYEVHYYGTNKEGFKNKVVRKIIVADFSSISEDDASGDYDMMIDRGAERGPYSISVTKLAKGVFYIQDFLGGWYWFGASYGFDYGVNGYFLLDANNEMQLIYSESLGWGDPLDDLTDSSFDPNTGVLKFSSHWSGYVFKVQGTKQP